VKLSTVYPAAIHCDR